MRFTGISFLAYVVIFKLYQMQIVLPNVDSFGLKSSAFTPTVAQVKNLLSIIGLRHLLGHKRKIKPVSFGVDVGGACETSFLLAVAGCGKESQFSLGVWSVVGCLALQWQLSAFFIKQPEDKKLERVRLKGLERVRGDSGAGICSKYITYMAEILKE